MTIEIGLTIGELDDLIWNCTLALRGSPQPDSGRRAVLIFDRDRLLEHRHALIHGAADSSGVPT